MDFIKVLLIVAATLILFFPLFPFPLKMRRFSTFRALRYDPPHNRLNVCFFFFAILEFVLLAILYNFIFHLADTVTSVPFIAKLLSKVSAGTDFAATVFCVIILNVITLYALVFFKSILRGVMNPIFGFSKKKAKKKKKKKGEETVTESEEGKTKKERKLGRIGRILRSKKKKEDEEEDSDTTQNTDEPLPERVTTAKNEKFQKGHPILYRIYQAVWGLFFEKPDFVYARRYVFTAVNAIQFFLYIVEVLYGILFFGLLLGVFFSMPDFLYKAFDFVTTKIYIYPFISILLLQELCNTFRSACKEPEEIKRKIEREAKEEKKKKKIALEKLRSTILRRYAKNHNIRYFPAIDVKELTEYNATNDIYKDALSYISTYMKNNYGRVIQSYMSGLDAVFNGRHVYFGSSFYSQLGEYIITYTYVRLLAGERMIFIVSDRSQVVKLQQYIGNRLTDITGVTRHETWRVYSADSHHVNEADVLIGVPEDFQTDNLVENYPAFFEEACNAVFVDADRILNLNSYLCTIMASRLMTATENGIRFMFLSRDVLQGFSASLRKFFCIDEEIVDCNSAEENENVAYMLWNRERGALYNKHGQSETTIECLIADAAYDADVDGIRILTTVPLKPAEKQNFVAHDVEINEFHKKVPRVNYMICTDDCSNLAAAIYAYTRFHGREASIVHILSRPYLLREYFGARVEMYANRSDLIKPRATEHADTKKLLLLRLLCEATASHSGIPITRFSERIDAAMKDKGLAPAYDLTARVAFLLSELMNAPEMLKQDVVKKKSDGEELRFTMASRIVYNYYSVIQPERKNGYELKVENHISFLRIEEVFEKLLVNNRRVALYLNGNLLGHLDTFPERVYQQYLPGQSLIFDNCEYEIESIVDGGNGIYLRQENITYNSCMDTALLRRYQVKGIAPLQNSVPGVYHFTTGALEKICVDHRTADVYGETYGFYNLMANSQTLDFVEGVVGNPAVDEDIVKKQARKIKGGRLLSVRLYARDTACTDGMRKLLAAVLSEFVRTMFPDAFRCIAVCPVLKTPTDATGVDGNFNKQVETLYPYLVEGEGGIPAATDDCIELLIINDAVEDIGVLDRLYDGAARIMEEIFSYIVDYLKWLKENANCAHGRSHYIYFGSDKLPEVYDLDGCIALLSNCVRAIDTGSEEAEKAKKEERCSFCHCPLETGRYSAFDGGTRFICFDCETTGVGDDEQLAEVLEKVKAYWENRFPGVSLPEGVTVELDDARDVDEIPDKHNHYYRTDADARKITVECDVPENSAFAYILRGYLAIWQKDNDLITPQAEAVQDYEELCFLTSVGAEESASWIREHLDDFVADALAELEAFIAEDASRTSLDFLRETAIVDDVSDDDIEPTPEDETAGESGGLDSLFDPDRVPRFWKRYLRRRPDDEDSTGATHEDDDGETVTAEGEDSTVEDDTAEGDGSTAKADKDEATAKKERRGFLAKQKTGAELIPHEPEEDVNPRIRLYNEIARHVADYNGEMFSMEGLSLEDARSIFYYVMYDYPEFFWMETFRYSSTHMSIVFRCTNPDGSVNVAMIQKNRNELRRSVKFFTKGITKKTKPYDAMLTIYRRLILNLDYDGVGLDSGAGRDVRNEDTLRSLHSALVEKKVVCVGYAVAMQYLLQSVGICCGQVVSKTHSWNVIKFGKYCYFLDATWGDSSNTKSGGKYKNNISYGYCCVPAKENLGGNDANVRMPDGEIFRELEEFRATKHEYCRVHGGYLTTYNEEKLAELFAKTAKEKPFEGSTPCIPLRCADKNVFHMVQKYLWTEGGIFSVTEKAKALLGSKDKKAIKFLSGKWTGFFDEKSLTIHLYCN